ncbi:MAG: WYL domain-containing protein [Clostridia bacterium]|nr:WYL domain-containing protein [Clostridia bacterium]
MDAHSNKKMLILYILDILKKRTDYNHRLHQQDIIELLAARYGVTCERKAVARNINSLRDFGYDIQFSNGYYLAERDFDDSELQMLITSVLFAKNMPASQRNQLIEKLSKLSSDYFSCNVSNVAPQAYSAAGATENRQLLYTISIVDEAISSGVQVSFTYNAYGTDKALHPRRKKKYTVNPYQIVAANGRFYLICCGANHDTLSSYRVDRITNIALSATPLLPLCELPGRSDGYMAPRHMAESLYMHLADPVPVRFRIDKNNVNDVLDWFSNCEFSNETDATVEVSVTVNEDAMLYWALQYGRVVEVLSPLSLRQRIRSVAGTVYKRHG